MANEVAVCIETPSKFGRYTIAAGAVLPVGTAMILSADNTVSESSTTDQAFEGFVWEIASTAATTFTQITLALDGVWDVTTDAGSDNRGTALALVAKNTFGTADAADFLNGAFAGYLEEASGNATTDRLRLTKFGSSGKL